MSNIKDNKGNTVNNIWGVAKNFQREGGVPLCQKWGYSPNCHVFLPTVVGCLLKKSSQKGVSQAAKYPVSSTPEHMQTASPLMSLLKQF